MFSANDITPWLKKSDYLKIFLINGHFRCVSVTEWQWKVVAERLGFRANEIKFLDMRYRNPSEAALAFVTHHHGTNVDDLYDVLTECGMPVLADIL